MDRLPGADLSVPKFLSSPDVFSVGKVPAGATGAMITSIVAADFDADGRADLAVSWLTTNSADAAASQRKVTFLFNLGNGTFLAGYEVDLYQYDAVVPDLSIFRNGPSEIVSGDFDGDGDLDVAVLPYFGDELWFLENLGGRKFDARLKFIFGSNSTGNFLTPPKAIAADFDGDGRDDLAYITDPLQRIDGLAVHFWKTSGHIEDMARAYWQADSGSYLQWTRALTNGDFDGDGRPDFCLAGVTLGGEPTLQCWSNFNLASQLFHVTETSLATNYVDAATLGDRCDSRLALTDPNGAFVDIWTPVCGSSLQWQFQQTLSGYANLAPGRGASIMAADLDGNLVSDLVTHQKQGTSEDHNQVQITDGVLGRDPWTLLVPSPIDSHGFTQLGANQILQPRNLACADLQGNHLPEVVTAFDPLWYPQPDPQGNLGELQIVIWRNGCPGDVGDDGQTDLLDVVALLGAYGSTAGGDADINRDGVVDLDDLAELLANYGCSAP